MITTNDNDDDGENENDDKNNYKQEFPHGRTLTLHHPLVSKCKSKKEEERERKLQLANFNMTRNSLFNTVA
jgi:hypothetical protein